MDVLTDKVPLDTVARMTASSLESIELSLYETLDGQR